LKKIEQLDDMHGPLLKRAMADSRSTNTKVIRFMQFNILAEGLSAPPKYGGFVFSPKECLEWGFRKFRVVEEIIKYDPDVLCLEEVDHFDDFLLPALKNFGYEGIFQPKTDSPTLQFGDDKFSDGCAIFWKKEILKIVDQKSVIYKNPDLEGSAWSQVALIARMTRANDEGSPFIVSCTHLKSKPGKANELRRTIQLEQLLASVQEMQQGEEPTLIFGDFNTDPTGRDEDLTAYEKVKTSSLNLKSAYTCDPADEAAETEEPEYTTCKVRENGEACHTIDYIWVPKAAQVLGVLGIPDYDSLPKCKLPCFEYPSDHLSIAADVVLPNV